MLPVNRLLAAALAAAMLCGAAVARAEEKPKSGPGAAGAGAPQMPPPEVLVTTLEKRDIPLTYEYTGVTEASLTVEVRARVKGWLEKRAFKEGANVKEGELLYQIDPRSFQADVKIADARVAAAVARLNLADRELKRLTALGSTGAVAQGDVDRAEADYLDTSASLQLARADLDKWKLQLSYTQIFAPVSGTIDKTQRDVGSLVDDGEHSLLTKITQISPIYVTMSISESDYLGWRQRTRTGEIVVKGGGKPQFQITLHDGTVFPEIGTMNFEEIEFDQATGTARVRAEFPNTELSLRPGQSVKVRVLGWERPGSLAVPQRAVLQNPMGAIVFVVGPDNTVGVRPVKLGPWTGSEWVILEGVQAGERVMVEGFMKAAPGTVVVAKPYVPGAPISLPGMPGMPGAGGPPAAGGSDAKGEAKDGDATKKPGDADAAPGAAAAPAASPEAKK